ncbi:Methyltransf_11 domain-containing protein [Durusdinium trenchii]|uniref:Methyltransf_11 domain-containing protein n=1 Tax=Durusdinium trenchii TaxID=1381693 RepID=A0ABP0RCW7_9DINO
MAVDREDLSWMFQFVEPAKVSEADMPSHIAVTTWNTWGVPWASPLVFHRASKWRDFHDKELQKLIGDHNAKALSTKGTPPKAVEPRKDLLVCCFQEVFSFPKGPLMDFTSRCDPSQITPFWEKFVLTLGILCRFLSCTVWDAPRKLSSGSIHRSGDRIEYGTVVGQGGMSLAWNGLVDSGLCILSTWEPVEKGFMAYQNVPGGCHEERVANKGVIWAFWDGVLVLNTHLTTRRHVKPRQLEELRVLFEHLRTRFLLKSSTQLSIYLHGDFNLDPNQEEFFGTWHQNLGLELITAGLPTNAKLTRALDHIFLWRSNEQRSELRTCSNPIKPWDTEAFCGVPLSDHCWQGVILTNNEAE